MGAAPKLAAKVRPAGPTGIVERGKDIGRIPQESWEILRSTSLTSSQWYRA